jgi:hypothetical protein
MADANNTANDAIQIDEDILTYTVSDEALEAAAGTEGVSAAKAFSVSCSPSYPACC